MKGDSGLRLEKEMQCYSVDNFTPRETRLMAFRIGLIAQVTFRSVR